MNIILEKIGRRFNREWIFRDLNYEFNPGSSYAILGPNGSGKSTLLQILAGSLTPSEGSLTYRKNGESINVEEIYSFISISTPYLDLIEEFTLAEHIGFHFKFKPFRPGIDAQGIVDLLGLGKSADKPIRFFSSGMKQRLKLGLAFCTDSPLLLLDEPTTNLDQQGVEWYQSLVSNFSADRLVIVCSNQKPEYEFCDKHLSITDYK